MDDFDSNGFEPSDYEPFCLRDLRGRPEEGGAYWLHEGGKIMECLVCGQHTQREVDLANKYCDLCRRRLGRADVAGFSCWSSVRAAACRHARADATLAQEQRYLLGRFDLACRRLVGSPGNSAALAWNWGWLRALYRSLQRQVQ